MSAVPSFSVIICNYNYADFVGQAIQSALDQRYPPGKLQVIVVDDGSTDGSQAAYTRFADDARFEAVLQENRGQTAAFAAGVKLATVRARAVRVRSSIRWPGTPPHQPAWARCAPAAHRQSEPH